MDGHSSDIAMRSSSRSAQAELWGGLECSVVRLDGHTRDQFRETGHDHRISDLEDVARLGIRTLRYPVSWERVAPDQPMECNWAWHDERLAELRRLGITPIVGLVHHGSGPAYTSLLDPLFPDRLADFASRVARRYPWIEAWTPVNEPLTTARFSGLYGHWFPHHRSEQSFLKMVALQCRGVLLAMRAVRRENPRARLVQTEDLGHVFSTPPMQRLAEYENSRRWLSLDLLCGRVDEMHPWYAALRRAGVDAAMLDDFRQGELQPMTIGVNHYVTSDRFLDHRVSLYPEHGPDGEGSTRHINIEAVRVPLAEGSLGWLPRLREVWMRYPRHSLAVTEAHIACTEPEQARWLNDCWQATRELRDEGADLRAVTVWSLFGAIDWCSMLTARNDRYEPGAFDIRNTGNNGRPRPRLLAEIASVLAGGRDLTDPMFGELGWWARSDRVSTRLRSAFATDWSHVT